MRGDDPVDYPPLDRFQRAVGQALLEMRHSFVACFPWCRSNNAVGPLNAIAVAATSDPPKDCSMSSPPASSTALHSPPTLGSYVKWPKLRFLRWLGVVPEVGDTVGWAKHFLIRVPVTLGLFLAIMGAYLLVTPLGLRTGARFRAWGALVVWVALMIIGVTIRAMRMRNARRRALAAGARPYAVVRVRRQGLLLKLRRARTRIPWPDVVSASAGDRGFEITWLPDGHMAGIEVSPSQSSLLPSGELPDNESMAEWINAIAAAHRCGVSEPGGERLSVLGQDSGESCVPDHRTGFDFHSVISGDRE